MKQNLNAAKVGLPCPKPCLPASQIGLHSLQRAKKDVTIRCTAANGQKSKKLGVSYLLVALGGKPNSS